jgi:hypothetical protein
MFKRRCAILCLLFSLTVLACGCQTVAGGASGMAEGAVKDAQTLCGAIGAVDSWIKKNLW